MANYEKMYHKLFNAITDSINILQQAQLQTEEMYISQEDASSNSFQSDAYSENRNSGKKQEKVQLGFSVNLIEPFLYFIFAHYALGARFTRR